MPILVATTGLRALVLVAVALLISAEGPSAQVVIDSVKIEDPEGESSGDTGGGPYGGGYGPPPPGDDFGSAIASLGDLDGDGVGDLAVGALADGSKGAVYVVFPDADGSVGDAAYVKITEGAGGFPGELGLGAGFGSALAALPDLDGDGIPELAVGVPGDLLGAVWILFLTPAGTVRAATKIDAQATGMGDALFGGALTALGDLDGDGVTELAVGTQAVRVLFLARDGSLKSHRVIRPEDLGGVIDPGDGFGASVAALGDRDGNGLLELAVGAPWDDDIAEDAGAVWFLELLPDGSVGRFSKLLPEADSRPEQFGHILASMDDVDGDFLRDLAIGGGGLYRLEPGSGATRLGTPVLWLSQRHTRSVASLGDQDGNGVPDLAVGVSGTGSFLNPYFWSQHVILYLLDIADGTELPLTGASSGAALAVRGQTDSTVELMVGRPDSGGGQGHVSLLTIDGDADVLSGTGIGANDLPLGTTDAFGSALAALGDLDGDGMDEIAVGGPGAEWRGSVWVLSLDDQGDVAASTKLANGQGGLGVVPLRSRFGSALARLGDLDGDGRVELAVGAPAHLPAPNPVPSNVWIVSLEHDGSVFDRRIFGGSAGFPHPLVPDPALGAALAALGDLDGDGVGDLAVGAPLDDDGGTDRGAVWIVLLAADGSVRSAHKISQTSGGFAGQLADEDGFGSALGVVPHIGGAGGVQLAVGAPGADEGAADAGVVWLLSLRPDGSVESTARMVSNPLPSQQPGGGGARFGSSVVAFPALLPGASTPRLAVGAPGIAVWLVDLQPTSWTNLGLGLGGAGGVPTLTGTGALVVGHEVRLDVGGALPGALVNLVLGFDRLDAPFHGGLLVPRPDLVVRQLVVGADGSATLQGRWPREAGVEETLFAQGWIADPAGLFGYAATNAIARTAP